MNDKNIDAICNEILWSSSKNEDGQYRIPILLDFDFTCTKNSSCINDTWEENPHCFETLKKWEKMGCVFILDTIKAQSKIKHTIWLYKNGVNIYGMGRNPDQDSGCDKLTKVWGVFSIDDRNVGSFLVYEEGERPYIDWFMTDTYLTPILKKIQLRLPELEEEVIRKKKEVYGKQRK